MQILLVDDNSDIRTTLCTFLERKGHAVHTCPSAVEAWSSITQDAENFELVLTDVRMPQMGGVELARRMRARGSNTPIIFMAGALEDELMDAQQDLGPYAVLQKPFMLSALIDAMKEATGGDSSSKQ